MRGETGAVAATPSNTDVDDLLRKQIESFLRRRLVVHIRKAPSKQGEN